MKYFVNKTHSKYSIIFFTVIFNFIVMQISAQSSDEIVAQSRDTRITKDEFKMRYELSPHPDVDNFDSSLVKINFLNTLIAEKLLAYAAEKEGLDKSAEYKQAFYFMRDFYLRDALYKIEVKDKIIIPDSEYVKGKQKIGKAIQTKYIFSRDKNEIQNIHESLKNGASFDSILSTRQENIEQEGTREIKFGKMNEKIEDYLFKLSPGEYTPPVELQEGWYICKVYSVTNKNLLDEADLRQIERVVSNRIENTTYEKFYKRFFKGIVINADRDAFSNLYKAMNKFISENQTNFSLKNGKYTLYEDEVKGIRKLLDEKELDSLFVKFQNGPVTLNTFFDFMRMEGFDFINVESSYIKSRLNNYIATYIQNQILAREALTRGYDKLPDVAFNLKIWQDNYLSNLMMKKIYKEESVTDDEAYAFYSKNNRVILQPDEVKIAEILTDNLDNVKYIFDELDKGTNFQKLAKKYTLRDSLRNSGGEYDFHAVNKKGEIWKTASSMKIGEVYGPIKLPEGFAIIKLLDRKEGKREQITSFEEAKRGIKEILQTENMFKKLEDVTAKLAFENNVVINENVLNSIKVNNINMIVYRRFGFGGQQIAVPYTPNFTGWFKKYEELKKSITY